MLKGGDNIHFIAESIFNIHKRCETYNTNLNSLINKRAEAEKESRNIIKAIEMGIIAEQINQRLTKLERQINQLDFDIDREKQCNYTYSNHRRN